MARSLTDQVIVITGAGSGIGAATALACAGAGMDVVLTGRRVERLEQVADQVRRRSRAAEVIAGDVTDPGHSERLLDAAQKRFGRCDVVFANAGYGFSIPAHKLEMSELRRIFEVNYFAACELISLAARRLLAERRPGHLLMCSSALAKFTLANCSAYSATKAAQNHFCRAMRMELRSTGIAVSSVHPITTRTEFFDVATRCEGREPDPTQPFGRGPAWFLQSPERVASAIVRCLRRPRPEVWTSTITRLAAGVITAFPSLLDAMGRKVGT